MNWDSVRTFAYSEWASIAGPGLYIAAGFIAAVLAIWLVISWGHAAVISSQRRRLRILEEHEQTFARHFHGRSVEELAARLRTLEGYVASLPPRTLSAEQKMKLASMGAAPSDATYLAIEYDSSVAEAAQYAGAFIEAFASAPGWNVVNHPHPRMTRLPAPITVALVDPRNPSQAEQLLLAALGDARIEHGITRRTAQGMSAQLIISSR
jgi:hypothetical protein